MTLQGMENKRVETSFGRNSVDSYVQKGIISEIP